MSRIGWAMRKPKRYGPAPTADEIHRLEMYREACELQAADAKALIEAGDIEGAVEMMNRKLVWIEEMGMYGY